MKYLFLLSALILIACKDRVSIDSIERREHGLTYIKGTNRLVNGEVIAKSGKGKLTELHHYKAGKPIGTWYAYDSKDNITSHGFGIDASAFQKQFKDIDLTNSVLSINLLRGISFATLYLDNERIFEDPKSMVALSTKIFRDYSVKYKIDDILMFDDTHEYTISRSATINDRYRVDTAARKDKRTIFIK